MDDNNVLHIWFIMIWFNCVKDDYKRAHTWLEI